MHEEQLIQKSLSNKAAFCCSAYNSCNQPEPIPKSMQGNFTWDFYWCEWISNFKFCWGMINVITLNDWMIRLNDLLNDTRFISVVCQETLFVTSQFVYECCSDTRDLLVSKILVCIWFWEQQTGNRASNSFSIISLSLSLTHTLSRTLIALLFSLLYKVVKHYTVK